MLRDLQPGYGGGMVSTSTSASARDQNHPIHMAAPASNLLEQTPALSTMAAKPPLRSPNQS